MFTVDELKNYPVNWVNGMMVSSADLNLTDTAWNSAIRDARVILLKGAQYGLIPPLRDSRDRSNYPKFLYDRLTKELTLIECRAVTEGGYRIELTENIHMHCEIPADLPTINIDLKEDIEVYITVSIDHIEASGPVSVTAPPRRLYKCPKYELSVHPKKDQIGMSGVNHMKLAEFKWQHDTYEQDSNYIPPCLTVNSHPELLEIHNRLGGILNSINEICLKLTQDYRDDSRALVNDGAKWSETTLIHLSSQLSTYNDILPYESPILLISFFKNWIYFTTAILNLRKSNEFFTDYSLKFSEYLKHFSNSKIDYSHTRKEFDKIEEYMKLNFLLLKDLEEKFRKNIEYKVERIK